MRTIVVATERSESFQAVYVDGILRSNEETIYFSIIMEWVIDGEPVMLSQIEVDLPEYVDWPETLEKLKEMQGEIPEPVV